VSALDACFDAVAESIIRVDAARAVMTSADAVAATDRRRTPEMPAGKSDVQYA